MNALDHYITLGRSGLRVSPLCMGTMTFGEDWGWGSTPEDSAAIIDAYLDRGGNFLDTANKYHGGETEQIVGNWLAKSSGRRDRTVLATKYTLAMDHTDPNSAGNHRKNLHRAIDASLRRLQTD